jgi:hypothetical protein
MLGIGPDYDSICHCDPQVEVDLVFPTKPRRRYTVPSEKSEKNAYTAGPFGIPSVREARAAELIFTGIEQAGPSYEGRVFLNNPDAGDSTALTPETGYAGSFHVYGYGDQAPPAIAEAKAKQQKGGAPVAPIEKRVRVDEAALRAALDRSEELTVTVAPIPADPGGAVPDRPFQDLEIVFDPAATQR